MFPRIENQIIAFDYETTGVHWWKDKPFSFAITTEDSHDFYFDLRQTPRAVEWLKDTLPKCKLVIAHNAKFEAHFTRELTGLVDIPWSDTMVRAALIDEHLMSYDLDHLGNRYCGVGKDVGIYAKLAEIFGGRPTKNAQAPNLHRAPPELVGEYAKQDTNTTFKLWRWQEEEIKRQGLENVVQLEAELLHVLVDIERGGVRVDIGLADEAVHKINRQANDLQYQLNCLAGFEVNPNPSNSIKELFKPTKNADGLWVLNDGTIAEETPGGGVSIDSSVLRRMKHPAAEMILRLRKMLKTRDTFLKGHILGHHQNGIIHANFNQTKSDNDLGTGCMVEDTLIQTNRGWIKVVDVKVGDLVLDHNGEIQPVIDHFYNGVHQIYEITTEKGHSIKVTGNHPFYSDGQWVRADDLKTGDDLLVYGEPEEWRMLEEWPYAVSSWGRVKSTGKGGVTKPRIKNNGGGKSWGHLSVSLQRGDQKRTSGNKKDFTVHRLMAQLWGINGDQISHENGIAWDNNIQNLAGSTQKRNNEIGALQGSYKHSIKLTSTDVAKIKALKDKHTQQTVANMFNVSREMVRNIWNGTRHKHSAYQTKKAVYQNDKVARIAILPPEKTYGIEIGNTHTHLTNGIVTHNTGRLSVNAPALQQIHKRDKEIAAVVRAMFIPDEGQQWCCGDLSQAEMRWFAHYANVRDMIQRYAKDKSTDFYQLLTDLTGIPRNPGHAGGANTKQISLAAVFGMADGRLCEEMGYPVDVREGRNGKKFVVPGPEGQEKLNQFNDAVPGIKEFLAAASSVAKSRGYVRSIAGRHIRFPKGQFTHKAGGLILQSANADSIKSIMIAQHRLLKGTNSRLLLSVHDECDFSLDPDDIARGLVDEIKFTMESLGGIQCRVPHKCDPELGPNWWEASK